MTVFSQQVGGSRTPSTRTRTNPFADATGDITDGLRLSPLWWRLGIEQTITRYRRTVLGPFWIASSTIATGLALSVVFGALFGGDFHQTMPYVLSGVLCWSIVSGSVTEGSGAFLGAAGLMQTKKLPLTFHALLQMHRVIINFVHQVVAFWLMMLLFRIPVIPHWQLLFALPLLAITGVFIMIPVGMISARYRDINYMVGFVMQALFMLTPVFWRRSQMTPKVRWLADFNPFAHMLEVLREPFLGNPAPAADWFITILICLGSAVVAWVSLAFYRRRVVFWL